MCTGVQCAHPIRPKFRPFKVHSYSIHFTLGVWYNVHPGFYSQTVQPRCPPCTGNTGTPSCVMVMYNALHISHNQQPGLGTHMYSKGQQDDSCRFACVLWMHLSKN
eukprot:scpid101211/ scgid33858/ 